MSTQSRKILQYFLLVFFSGSILYSGYLLAARAAFRMESEILNDILVSSQTFAQVLDSQKFLTVQSTPADNDNPDYQAIRKKLVSIGNINKSLGIRWIYTVVPKGDDIVFSIDSIPLDDADHSEPGDIYDDASDEFRLAVKRAWRDGTSSIISPYTDQWGTFISTLVPIVDTETGKTVSVIVTDMNYLTFYLDKINGEKKLPYIVAILAELFILFIYFYIAYLLNEKQRINDSNCELQKFVEQVPGVIYKFQSFPDGRSCLPYASKGLWDVYEVLPEDVIHDASKLFARIYKSDLRGVASSVEESKQKMDTWIYTYRVKLPSKGLRWLTGQAHPEAMPDGSVLWYGYIYDITENKAVEEKILRRTEELEVINRHMIGRELKMIELKNEIEKKGKSRPDGSRDSS